MKTTRKHTNHLSLRFDEKGLFILDQTKLPFEESWVHCADLSSMEASIKALKVRGAPMIGLSACFFLSHLSETEKDKEKLHKASVVLEKSRPTAVNLIHYMKDFRRKLETQKALDWICDWAVKNWEEDVSASVKMADYGLSLIENKENFLTHCNTGGLAAASHGTALGVLCRAYEQNKNTHIYVDETRPLLQGGRLTAWELSQKKIPYTLICDSMAGSLMAQKKVDAIFVGADRIASNGDTANKIGTYSLSVLAKHHDVPFYIVAPTTTFDRALKNGNQIPVEQRSPEEVMGWVHPDKQVLWAPKSQVYNPAFDVTPAENITAWVTEEGVFNQQDVLQGAFQSCGQ